MALSCQSMARPVSARFARRKIIRRPQFLDRLAVLLRFGFGVFQADRTVLKGPLSIVICIQK
jgi:hypothetical protein